MAEYIYIDYSNLFISARYHSAKRKRTEDETEKLRADSSFRINFRRLYGFLAGDNRAEIKRCALFSSGSPSMTDIWQYATKAGFEVHLFERNVWDVEKKVDTALVAHMVKDAYTVIQRTNDIITLASSDSDFVPAIELLVGDRFRVEVCSWITQSREIQTIASKFIPLDDHLGLFDHRHENSLTRGTIPINSIAAAFPQLNFQQDFK